MNRLAMSTAASALLRAIVSRAGVPRDRILLTDVRSAEWHSLTFAGERHLLQFRIPPPNAGIVSRMCAGLEDAEFSIPGVIVADICIAGEPVDALDGSASLIIEALTIAED